MLLRKGEVWTIDSRKGRVTVKLLDDVDTVVNAFFDAELVAGVPHYMSRTHLPEAIGDTVTFRVSLTSFLERLDD